MSKNKIIPILTLFLVLFMVACAVNADDGNNKLKVSNDIGNKESTLNTNLKNKNLENRGDTVSNDTESNIIDTSFTQLAEDIKNSGGVLNLTHDYTYDPNKDVVYNFGINITGDLIINGNNHVIRAGDNGGVFYDNGAGDTDYVRECNIHNNSAGKRGGAIYMDSYTSISL